MSESIMPPNVILIVADQWRGDALGADGNAAVQTPNLDYLASRGIRFRHAYTACPSCIAARSILCTGMDQWHTGVLGMGRGQGSIPQDFPHTLAHEFSAAGYRTHLVGKGHFSPQRALMGFQSQELDESGRVESSGFRDDYRGWFETNAPVGVTPDDHGIDWNAWQSRPWHVQEHLHPTAWTMSRAIEFLKNRRVGQPFFLNLSFARPHSPYVPPAAYFEYYIGQPTPSPSVGDWAAMNDRVEDVVNPNAWRGKLSDARIHRARAGYYGEITFIDAQIGRLFNFMGRFMPAELADTCIVFISDHGDMQGDHHLWRKTYAYEGSARIPFIVVPPRKRPARRVADEVVELRDVMPTLLDLTGLPIPKTVIGRSVAAAFDAPATDWRPYIHGEHCQAYGREQEMQYVTDGRRKFIWLPRINVEQFFDLENDPGECHNKIDAPDRQGEIAAWRRHLTDELARRDCGWTRDGKPVCPDDRPLVSPYKDVRWLGEM
jgi:arylsulfatase